MKIKLIAFSLVLLASCKGKKDVTTPVHRDLTQAVYASGKLYPVNDYKVYSKLPGYIEKIHVHVGDSVKLGQPLMTIKSEVSELNVNSAKNLLDLARKNADENSPMLLAIKQDVASAKAKYTLDSTNFARFSNLMKENATSKLQLDQAKTQFDVSKENYLKALNTLLNSRDRLRTELQNAQIQYDAQVSNRNDYTIVSVMNGKVYDIIPKEGELVSTQIMLMEIGDGSQYEVELSVDETDISYLKKGQDILLTIDAYKEKVFKGKVMEAYPRINQSNKTSKVVASITLDPSITVYSGMSVEANIIISEKKNTLVIPREFLVEGNKVKLRSNDELVTIQKGAEDLEYVEILGGIDEHTEIKKP
ncbi:MAG TPA: efflux RND transporter periplasmic adaptor subunit [Bacteroidia bacterium]|jgi:multidrug efflux pump subunit AcrA (membrane-fusion protein)